MLTGRPPFNGETFIETVRQVIYDEVVPPSRLVPKVDRDLETICLKCLSKETPRRYASASELAADLDRHRKGESIHRAAPRPSSAGPSGPAVVPPRPRCSHSASRPFWA